MAAVLWLQIFQSALNVTDNVYNIVQRDTLTAVTLQIPSILLQLMKEPWTKPASASVSSHSLTCTSAKFLFDHPKLNSVIINSTSKSRKQHSSPNDKEGGKYQCAWQKVLALDMSPRTRKQKVGSSKRKKPTSTVCLRCHAWLRSTDLQQNSKSLIEDLPFEGKGLFSNIMNSILQDLDKSIIVSRTFVDLNHQRAPTQDSCLDTCIAVLN